MSSRLRNIAVSQDNYQRLKSLGKTGDSFNDVLSKLLSKIDVQQTPSTLGVTTRNRATNHD